MHLCLRRGGWRSRSVCDVQEPSSPRARSRAHPGPCKDDMRERRARHSDLLARASLISAGRRAAQVGAYTPSGTANGKSPVTQHDVRGTTRICTRVSFSTSQLTARTVSAVRRQCYDQWPERSDAALPEYFCRALSRSDGEVHERVVSGVLRLHDLVLTCLIGN